MPVRNLNIHEYQGKQLMAQFGVNVQKNRVVEPNGSLTPTQAAAALRA
jgi:succinyl-CoA synthetase beta subunit